MEEACQILNDWTNSLVLYNFVSTVPESCWPKALETDAAYKLRVLQVRLRSMAMQVILEVMIDMKSERNQ